MCALLDAISADDFEEVSPSLNDLLLNPYQN